MHVMIRSIQLFFCESCQAKRHRHDNTFHVVEKVGHGLLLSRVRGSFMLAKREGGK